MCVTVFRRATTVVGVSRDTPGMYAKTLKKDRWKRCKKNTQKKRIEKKTWKKEGVSKPRRIKRIRRIRRIHILRKIVISKLRRISIIFISLIILKKNFSYSFSHELPPRINIVFSVSNFLSTDNFKKIWICNERNMAVRLE